MFLAAVWLWTAVVAGQQVPEDAFRAYLLKHTRAVEMEAALSKLLPQPVEVLADQRGNRILIRGPSKTQELAQKALESLDRPRPAGSTPAAGTATQSAEPVLRSYPCSGDPLSAAAWLRGQLSTVQDLRVAADERTRQVLVLAPPEVQAEVARRLSQASTAVPSDASQPAAARPADGHPMAVSPAAQARTGATQSIPLQFHTAAQMESLLLGALGKRVARAQNAAPGVSVYAVTGPEGQAVDLGIHRQSNEVTVLGIGPLAESCARLVRALDMARSPTGQATQLISLRASRPADVGRAVAAIQTVNQAPGQAVATTPLPATKLAMLFQEPGGAGPAQPGP